MIEPSLAELIGAGAGTVVIAGASAFGSIKLWWWRQSANGNRPASSLEVKLIAAHVETIDKNLEKYAETHAGEVRQSREVHQGMWAEINTTRSELSRLQGRLDR